MTVEADEARSWAATASSISVGRPWTLAFPPELSATVGGLLDDDPPHRLGACPW